MSSLRDFTADTCAPRFRWIPLHVMQINSPFDAEAHSGSIEFKTTHMQEIAGKNQLKVHKKRTVSLLTWRSKTVSKLLLGAPQSAHVLFPGFFISSNIATRFFSDILYSWAHYCVYRPGEGQSLPHFLTRPSYPVSAQWVARVWKTKRLLPYIAIKISSSNNI